MGYERYSQGQRDPRDLSPDSNDTYSSARDYEAAGYYDRDRGGYGRERGRSQGYGAPSYGRDRGFDQRPSGYYGNDWNDRGGSQRGGGYDQPYLGSYAHDGFRWNDPTGREEDDNRRAYGRQPQRQDPRDRGFFDRAGDEVRSWFGDSEAERRREQDARLDQQRDSDYRDWRSGQIAALDRDYDEYRNESRTKFNNEFSNWRTERQGQRTSLGQVNEHMDVVGSDGSHVGTVDKVRGDRIVLTKSDPDAGGRHHSIPSRWIDKVDDKVTLRKTAEEAKAEWRDEERNQAFFGEDRDRSTRQIGDDRGAHLLNRSFSVTY